MDDKIAFLILAHSDPFQLLRLCRSLGTEDDIYVHLDRKTDATPFSTLSFPTNVRFIEPRHSVYWADISMIDAMLALIRHAIGSGHEYVRLVLISGACYPIKKISYLRAYFCDNRQRNEVKYFNLLESPKDLKHLTRFHFRLHRFFGNSEKHFSKHFHELIRRSASLYLGFHERDFVSRFPGLFPYFGSQWLAITSDCAKFISAFVKKNDRFLRFFRASFAPDEIFFQTIIGNSQFSRTSDGLVRFAGRGKTDLANLHIINSDLKKVYTMSDLQEIMASPKFFVRKVSSTKSGALLDYIDQNILN
jgi:core-2/I-Branching enzyme